MHEKGFQAKVFLSCTFEDAERVAVLRQWLVDAGHIPWIEYVDILPGEDRHQAIVNSLHESQFIFICLSKKSLRERGDYQAQIREALEIWKEMLADDIFIIPVLLEDCDIPENIRIYQPVFLYQQDSWSRLEKAIQIGLEKRQKKVPITPASINKVTSNSDYQYDVFLSFPCKEFRPVIETWAELHFIGLLHHFLEHYLGRYPLIYIARLEDKPLDHSIHSTYKYVLAHTRCLIPIWAPAYFLLSWPRYECSMMKNREVFSGVKYGTFESPPHLILPVIGSDGTSFPDYTKEIPALNCSAYVKDSLAFKNTPKWEEYEGLVEHWIRDVVTDSIRRAPVWTPEWQTADVIPYPPVQRPIFPFTTMYK